MQANSLNRDAGGVAEATTERVDRSPGGFTQLPNGDWGFGRVCLVGRGEEREMVGEKREDECVVEEWSVSRREGFQYRRIITQAAVVALETVGKYL